MQPLEHSTMLLELKAVDLRASTFEGFSAGIGNLDDGNDRLMPGSFSKTIKQRVSTGKVKFLDMHPRGGIFGGNPSTDRLWGHVLEASEVELKPSQRKELARRAGIDTKNAPSHALHTLFKVSGVQAAQDALTKIGEGILDALSIGYVAHEVKFVELAKHPGRRHRKAEGQDDEEDEQERLRGLWMHGRAERQIFELAWWETSAVIWGQNPAALALPATIKALHDFNVRVGQDLTEAEQSEVREVIEALQQLAPGCPTKGAVDAVLPQIERVAELLEGQAPVFDLEALYDAFLENGEHSDANRLSVFMDWSREREGAALPEGDGDGMSDHKAALPFQRRTASNRPWSAGREVARADGRTELRAIHAWVDPSGDAEAKSSYKLPHHHAEAGFPSNRTAVSAAIAALNGARGGVNIPSGDRRPTYGHLRRELTAVHGVEAGDVPPLRGAGYDPELAEMEAFQLVADRGCPESKGRRLAALLDRLIDARATGGRTRADVIRAMADAAGISPSTVTQILRAEIICPPLRRLRGFARALGTSLGRLRASAESDGCEYGDEAAFDEALETMTAGASLDGSGPGVIVESALLDEVRTLIDEVRAAVVPQAAKETPPEGRRSTLPESEELEAELASLELMELEHRVS